MTAIQRLIDAAGGQKALAEALCKKTGRPIRQAHVWKWKEKGKLPVDLCGFAEQIVGGRVTCQQLAPEVKWIRKRGRPVAYVVTLPKAA